MDLKKHFSLKNCFIVLYFISLFCYLIVGFLPAEASSGSDLMINSIHLSTQVSESKLINGDLEVPDTIVGSFSQNENKVFLFGHSSTVFNNLHLVELRDEIFYNNKTYRVVAREILPKENIVMSKILKRENDDTIVIMSCAGEYLENQDSTHRLILTAKVE